MRLLNFNEFLDQLNESKEAQNFEMISESFKSSILQRITTKGELGKEFYNTLSRMGVAVSEITNNDINIIPPDSAAKWSSANPNHILIYYSNREKPNPYEGEYTYGSRTIPKDTVLGVVKGKTFMGLKMANSPRVNKQASYNLVSASKGDTIGIDKTSGKYGSGITTVNKLAEVTDIVYIIDPDKMPSSNELRQERKESKQGAIAFLNDTQFRKQNQSRYEAILRERASNTDIDKLVQDCIDELTKQIKDGVASKSKSKFGEILIGLDPKGREIKMSDAGNLMNKVITTYSNYASDMNNAESSKSRHGEIDTYYTNSAARNAKYLKDYYNKIINMNYAW